MSIEMFVKAERKIYWYKSSGEAVSEIQSKRFKLWQLPTEVMQQIVTNSNQLEAYQNYVCSNAKYESEPCIKYYTEDGFSKTVKQVNHGLEHLQTLTEWINKMEANGFNISFGYH